MRGPAASALIYEKMGVTMFCMHTKDRGVRAYISFFPFYPSVFKNTISEEFTKAMENDLNCSLPSVRAVRRGVLSPKGQDITRRMDSY